jgi:hypothetical protein
VPGVAAKARSVHGPTAQIPQPPNQKITIFNDSLIIT